MADREDILGGAGFAKAIVILLVLPFLWCLPTALMIGEFALTCMLLVGASLMLRTLGNLHHADPGYSTGHIVTFDWTLPDEAYPSPAQRLPPIERALERLAYGLRHWL